MIFTYLPQHRMLSTCIVGLDFISCNQGCGLGLDISVSRRTKLPTSRLGCRGQRLGLISVSSQSRALTSRAHPWL